MQTIAVCYLIREVFYFMNAAVDNGRLADT